MEYCALCNKPKDDTHHLVFGVANRKLADADNLVIPLCREHHEMFHKNAQLSKIIGQLMYERDKCAEGYGLGAARDSFMLRYGKNYMW